MKVHCLSCGKQYGGEEIVARLDAGVEIPLCDDCGGILKSMTVSFGENLPQGVWMEAARLARDCDLFLALGSSLVVYPAAGLPEAAVASGARLVIINREPTPLDSLAELVVNASIGETMQAVMAEMDRLT